MGINKKIISTIIFQAPGDIAYGLDIYRQHFKNTKFIFLVINVKSIYEFLNFLHLDVERIIFVPYNLLEFRNPIKIIKEKYRIKYLQDFYFSNIEVNNVYFFSRYEDWLTGAFLHFFLKYKFSKLYYCSYYDNSEILHKEIKITFRKRIYLLILEYLTGVKFNVKYLHKFPEFPINTSYNTSINNYVNAPEIYEEYKYQLRTKNNFKSVLFFLSDCDESIFDITSFINVVNQSIEYLNNNNITIYIKGHPRLGLPHYFNFTSCVVLPSYIPAEFISSTTINYYIGIETYSLCYFAKNMPSSKSISLLKLVKGKDIDRCNFFVEYLKMNSDNQIFFPTKFDFL